MSLKSIGSLKDSLSGLLQGVNLNNITNLNGAIERATRTLLTEVDIMEATGKQSVTLYNGVYDYAAPTDIFGGVFLDLRPQGITRTSYDYTYKKPIEMFDRTKLYTQNGTMIAFEYNKGTPIMRVVETTSRVKATLDPMNVTTGWTAAGDASSLATDLAIFYQSPACLRFNLASSGSQGTLTKAISSVDLTDYEGVGVVFLAVYLPSATAITSLTLRLGSDASNYFSVTETEGMLGAWKANEWTLIAFDLSTATETGTVDITKVDYAQILTNYDGTALTNVRFGALFISMPASYELIYGTSAIFKVGTTMSNSITDDNDEIVLNDAAYLLLEYEAAQTIAIQSGGTLSSGLVQMYRALLHGQGGDLGLYAQYRADNPSQEVRFIGSWYDDER
jgi:hypothetical protein